MMIDELFDTMLTAARDAITSPVARAVVPPGGEVVWDECCAGQMHLQMLNVEPMSRMGKCQTPWSVKAVLGVIRCIEVVDDYGRAPTQEAITEDGKRGIRDAHDLSCVLLGPVAAVPGVEALKLLRWQPLGAGGGCAGGEWEFSFTWLGCDCDA